MKAKLKSLGPLKIKERRVEGLLLRFKRGPVEGRSPPPPMVSSGVLGFGGEVKMVLKIEKGAKTVVVLRVPKGLMGAGGSAESLWQLGARGRGGGAPGKLVWVPSMATSGRIGTLEDITVCGL